MIPFSKWKFEQIERTFNIKENEQLATLKAWLSTRYETTVTEEVKLNKLRHRLIKKVNVWNETELQVFFIGQFLDVVNYESSYYSTFLERPLSANINDVEVGGKVDFMLATGRQDPYEPYFFIHEYKPEKGRDNDPLGQVLIAMLTAQTLNQREMPIYGAYVVGRLWFFVVLQNDEYAVSLAYDATQNDIFDIFAILRKVKDYIDEQITAQS